MKLVSRGCSCSSSLHLRKSHLFQHKQHVNRVSGELVVNHIKVKIMNKGRKT